jgi:hypothetical protein
MGLKKLTFRSLTQGLIEHIDAFKRRTNGIKKVSHGEIFTEGNKVALFVYVFVDASVGMEEINSVVIVFSLGIKGAYGDITVKTVGKLTYRICHVFAEIKTADYYGLGPHDKLCGGLFDGILGK